MFYDPLYRAWELARRLILLTMNPHLPVLYDQGLGAGKAADLTYWESAARMIADVCTTDKIVSERHGKRC